MSKVSVSFDTMEPEPSSATPVSEGALEESYEKFYRGVPGAMTVKEGDRLENDYAWLDQVDEDDCYMPLELSNSRPSKSLDFGKDGFTGSISTWHELLQITAPDPECGLVFVRGDFPDNPDSILARAQRRNQRGTLGMAIRIPHGANWVQEATAAQGMVNLRWPFTRLHWTRKDDQLGSVHIASFTVCSFVKDGIVYQIARVVPRKLTKATPTSSLENLNKSPSDSNNSIAGRDDKVEFAVDVGGVIRFGCPSTAVNRTRNDKYNATAVPPAFYDRYTRHPERDTDTSYVFTCESEVHRKRLEMRVWIDQEPQELKFHSCQSAKLQHGPRPKPGYQEVCSFHVLKEGEILHDDRPTVIVASFALVDAHTPRVTGPIPVISYTAVKSYLGVADHALWAPYRLWSSFIGPSSSTGDSVELNAIGRVVETILGVACIPIPSEYQESSDGSPATQPDHANSDTRSTYSTVKPNKGVALLKNIMTPQEVDLESAFWQVRLLIKAAELFELQPNRSHFKATQADQYRRMQTRYRSNIIERLRAVCLWVLKTARAAGLPDYLQDKGLGLLSSDVQAADISLGIIPSPADEGDKRACKQLDTRTRYSQAVGDQKYYCAMILWLVLHKLPEVIQERRVQDDFLEYFTNLACIQTPDKSGIVAIDDPTGCIVRWYHNFCIANIYEKLRKLNPAKFSDACTEFERQIEARKRSDTDPASCWRLIRASMKDPEDQTLKDDIEKWQARAEKSMRLFEQGRLSGRNLGHEAANLAYVGQELGIEDKAITLRGKSCLEIASQLIKKREPTNKLSPGRSRILRWDPQHDVRSAKPRPAPWELSCLAQQVPYNIGVVKSGEHGKCLDMCKEFMFSDYTFMASWDASKMATVGQWWDFVTSSIICAKLLEEATARKAEELREGKGGKGGKVKKSTKQSEDRKANSLELEKVELLRKLCEYHRESSARAAVTGFDLMKRKPRMLYHSDSTARSLEDTPDVYRLNQTQGVVRLRQNLWHYLYEVNYMPPPRYSLHTIANSIGPSKVHNLSCFDIIPITDRNDMPEISEPIPNGRADQSFWFQGDNEEERERRKNLRAIFTEKPGLLDMYLIGKAKEHRCWKQYRDLLANDDLKANLLAHYQESLFTVLNNSLVDQGVKYRIIFAKHLSPATLQALVYMWHPDALDTMDDHLGELSTFSSNTMQSLTGSEDTWITSITIKHWRLLGEEESITRNAEQKVDEDEIKARKAERGREKEKKEHAEERQRIRKQLHLLRDGDDRDKTELTYDYKFPPHNVADDRPLQTIWKQTGSMAVDHLSRIHELGLSLVITGDERGRSWTCTIICELFSEKEVAEYASEVSHTLQMFIHQQYTGRELVFLLLLGYMCEKLAKECDCFMTELDGIMNLNPRVLLDGMEWEKSDRALRRLKQMLWGFEALRVFGDKLKKALDAVEEAGDKMKLLLDNGKEIRHKDMVSGVESVKEEYEKRCSRLQHAYNSLEQRVDQGIKLREGISSVLGVEQNENISMLTWLTIIYLGPVFLTSLFGIDPIHGIIPATADLDFFYKLLGGFVGGTILFALLLRYIIEAVRWILGLVFNPLRKNVWRPSKEYSKAAGVNLLRMSKETFTTQVGSRTGGVEQAGREDIENPEPVDRAEERIPSVFQ